MTYRGSDNHKAHKHELTNKQLVLIDDTEPRGGKKSRRTTRRVWV